MTVALATLAVAATTRGLRVADQVTGGGGVHVRTIATTVDIWPFIVTRRGWRGRPGQSLNQIELMLKKDFCLSGIA